jgi:hypothetical protein
MDVVFCRLFNIKVKIHFQHHTRVEELETASELVAEAQPLVSGISDSQL